MQSPENQAPRFPGDKVTIGDREFVVPPLTFKQIRNLEPQIKLMGSGDIRPGETQEKFNALITVVHAALSRNYPQLSRDDLEDLIDLSNVLPVVNAVMGVSGFRKLLGEGGAGDGVPLAGIPSTQI